MTMPLACHFQPTDYTALILRSARNPSSRSGHARPGSSWRLPGDRHRRCKRLRLVRSQAARTIDGSLMRLHSLVPLIAAAANLLVCVPVLRQRSREPIHWAFAWMTLTIAAWNLGIFSLYYFTDIALAERWSRIFRTGICFCPVAVFHVAMLQAGSRGRKWTAILGAGYAVATL